MGTFVGGFLLALVILGVFSAPVMFFAYGARRFKTVRNFGVGAVLVAALCGFLALSSERLINQCLDKGNPPYNCTDSGGAGMQVVFITIFVLVALVNAYWLRPAQRRR